MSCKIVTLPNFEKEAKRLKKRFPKIKNDIKNLVEELYKTPTLGISLGNGFYKIRVANSSVPTGKSGGFRVITYYKYNDTIYLVTIYSKSDEDSILIEKLKQLIKEI